MTSNRDIEKLFEQWNPNNIRAGDRVRVRLHEVSYQARVVGLDLDVKNKKVYANLRLMDNTKRFPSKVDVADCTPTSSPTYPGHYNNG